MRQLTYLSGYVFTLIWSLGLFFKVMHLPGAMLLLTIGGAGVAFLFLPVWLTGKLKSGTIGMTERLQLTFGALSVVLLMVGSWMKFAHSMGAGFMIGLTLLVFGLGYLPVFFLNLYRQSHPSA